jgi:uncharacterized protein
MPATPTNIAVTIAEVGLLVAGLVLLWRYVLSERARKARRESGGLPAWDVSVSDFLLFAFLMIAGGLVAGLVAGAISARWNLAEDTRTIVGSAAFQLGLLIAPALLPFFRTPPATRPLSRSTAFGSGLATFLIALPIVTLVNLLWLQFLKVTGLPTEQQDLLRMFSDADEPALIILLVVLATLVAPVTEELLFRAIFFRYLRTRIPRWLALVVPGTIFAALHVNWPTLEGLPSLVPLITLAVIFSIAYERTGKITTAMVAHGLFNLHTILLLFSGATTV